MMLHDLLEDIFRRLTNDPSTVLTDETTPDAVAGWDSVFQINLMFALEQELGVRFAGNEIFEFETVGELKALIRRHTDWDSQPAYRAGR